MTRAMTLQLTLVKTAVNHRFTVQYLGGDEINEALRSGPVTNLGIVPRAGQLVAVDTTITPVEIAHVYDQAAADILDEAHAEALARGTFPAIIARHTPPQRPSEPDPHSPYMSWTGLAALIWDASGGDEPQEDHDYIKRAIEQNRGPALDVGCGTGRLLLRYLAAGLDVDGLEPSADMLAICRQKGAVQGLAPTLYRQSMHQMALPRRYQTIFIPCGTFCLLINREDAQQALRAMYDHLEPGGELLFNLFWEMGPGGWFWRDPDGKWFRMFYHTLANGDQVFQYMWTDKVDRAEQQFFGHRRYRLVSQGQVVREEILPSYERVYGLHEIRMMLAQAGFGDIVVKGDWTEAPFADGHGVMVIHARK